MKTLKCTFWLLCMLLTETAVPQEQISLVHSLWKKEHVSALLLNDVYMLRCSYGNHFLTKEISNVSLEGLFIHSSNGLLVNIGHSGFHAFGTLSVGAGYGRRFGQSVSVVLRGWYLWQHVRHYDATHSFTIELSGSCRITSRNFISVSLYNPIKMRYGIVGGETIPMSFRFCFWHVAGKQLQLGCMANKALPGGLEIGGHCIYVPIRQLQLELLCSNLQCRLSIMTGWRRWLLCVQTSWFFRTGITPVTDIIYYRPNCQTP